MQGVTEIFWVPFVISGGMGFRASGIFTAVIFWKFSGMDFQFCTHIHMGQSEQKPMNNFGKSSHVCSQGVSKIVRESIYRAHRAVIFAIAQISCYMLLMCNK